jgi:hypothetical protein
MTTEDFSIFSSNVTLKQLDNYNYYETNDNNEIYYVNLHWPDASFFIDKNKKIIPDGRYYHKSCYVNQFTPHMKYILDLITSNELENAVFVGDKVISICKWFVTYGHFKDEAFALCDFHHKFQEVLAELSCPSIKILLDYHTDNDIVKHYPVYKNYCIIDKYLFGEDSINAYDFRHNILKMNKLYLIKHEYSDPTFHLFPLYSTNKILSNIKLQKYNNKNVFITRGTAIHMNRNLDNEPEITEYLISNKYVIVNPEAISYDDFINNIKDVDNIVMSWGGMLTNMIYLKPNTNVIILKSKSYENETIELFNKIINTYKLNVKIIEHDNNKIMIPFC